MATEQTFIRDIDQARKFSTLNEASIFARVNFHSRKSVAYPIPYYTPGQDAPTAYVIRKEIKGRGHFLA